MTISLVLSTKSQNLLAASQYRINSSQSHSIDEFGICKDVTNNSSFDVLIPTNSSIEWSAFLAHLPPSVSAVDCATGCTGGSSSYNVSGTFTMPAGCNYATVKAWGGGGGGGASSGTASLAGFGAGAGYSTADVSILPTETLNVVIGQGGQSGNCTAAPVGGAGGYTGGAGGSNSAGGSGGGTGGGSGGTGSNSGGDGGYAGGGGGSRTTSTTTRQGGAGGGATVVTNNQTAIEFLIAGGGGGGGGASTTQAGNGGVGCANVGGAATGTAGGGGGGGACFGASSDGSSQTAGNSTEASAITIGKGGDADGACGGAGDGKSGEVQITYGYSAPMISIFDKSVSEGNNLVFVVSLTSVSTSNITFDFSQTDGSATGGTDYTVTNLPSTILSGQNVLSMTVPTILRGGNNGDRSFTANLSNVSGASVLDGAAIGNIFDTASCSAGSLSFAASGSFTVPVACTTLTIEVWGAGGASAFMTSGTAKSGGSGGYAKVDYNGVNPGDIYTFTIGQGGLCTQAAGSGAYSGGVGGNANACTAGAAGAGTGAGGSAGAGGGNGCAGGAGKYGGGGGGGGASASAKGGGGGGASSVSLNSTEIIVAGGGGGAGSADQGTGGAGGPACGVSGGAKSGGDAGGGGGGGACYCSGGCTTTANGTLAANPSLPGVSPPTSGNARGGPPTSGACSGTNNDGTGGEVSFTFSP